MLLADLGADVLRIARPEPGMEAALGPGSMSFLHRGRPALTVDITSDDGRELVLRACSVADVLVEGFRPGVMERLGLGPEDVWSRNRALTYGRLTGYGQDGSLSDAAGHDLNYLAISGALGAMARRGERPMFPLNLLADIGGGGLLLAFGVMCAAFASRRASRGQVVDASMVDGVAFMTGMIHGFRAAGAWSDEPGTNFLDSGAHFYDVYETADARHMAVAAIEPPFYAALLEVLGLDPVEAPQWDRKRWPELKERVAAVFRRRTRDEWVEAFAGVDACTTPVLSLDEAPFHEHNVSRALFRNVDGGPQPMPAPRFSATPAAHRRAGEPDGAAAAELLARWGIPPIVQAE